jgi:glutamate transport system permease protein
VNVLVDNADLILRGFRTTLALTALSGVLALALGTALAAIRVSPVAALRWFGTTYVTVVRNTPLVVLLIVFVFGLPELGFQFSFFVRAVIGLTVYTAAFVCEVLRSGINAVQPGQAEAARAVGMTFGQTLREIVLPQAFRTVVPPLGSVFIALTKNTAIAEAFGVTEATYVMDSLIRDFPGALYALFFGIAAGYIVIVLGISAVFRAIERNVLVLR